MVTDLFWPLATYAAVMTLLAGFAGWMWIATMDKAAAMIAQLRTELDWRSVPDYPRDERGRFSAPRVTSATDGVE